jgi:tetratricopeptide (TPR) repeat protein
VVELTVTMKLVTIPTTATTLLHRMALLAPAPIPVALFMDEETLAELERHGLISIQGRTVTVPPAVRERIRSAIPPEQMRDELTLLLQSVNRFAPASPSDPETWTVWDLLRPHAEALLARTEKVYSPDVSLLAGRLGAFLWAKDLLGEAEPLMRRALALDETIFGRKHPNVAIQLNNLALMLQDAGRPHEAEPLMREAVEILSKALGPDDPSTRGVRKNLEILMEELGYRHNW